MLLKLKEDAGYYDIIRSKAELNIPVAKRQKKYVDLDKRIEKTVSDFSSGRITIEECLRILMYAVKLQ